MSETKCTSCNKPITNDKIATDFSCPKCGKETITRCGNCRKTSIKYICTKCGFKGP